MGRIPEAEIERLKREVAVERLAAGRGVELRRHGADLIGRCPFHRDRTPSLVVTPGKNLWHCLGACNAGGGPIDWVMRAEGASFRRAVELLRAGYAPGARPPGEVPPRHGSRAKLEPPVRAEAGDAEALGEVAAFYHRALQQAPEVLAYLEKRGLRNEALIERFRLGFANRTLAYRLPSGATKAGAALRGRLQALGVLRASGHEHFNGSLVAPITTLEDEVVGMYGRKITARLREGTPDHLYLPGERRGVWNEAGLAEAGGEVILCEALLDAMTFWCAGFHNVTASYGVHGFTRDHRAAFARHGVCRVWLAYDPDAAGDTAAAALAAELVAAGIECLRVRFPRGLDANEYARKVTPAAKSLDLLLRNAEWVGGRAVASCRLPVASTTGAPAGTRSSAEPGPPESAGSFPKDKAAQPGATPAAAEHERVLSLAATGSDESPLVAAAGGGDELRWVVGGRRWRIRGLGKCAAGEAMKVNLMLAAGSGLHVDTLDLYAARQRQGFVKQAAEETGLEEDTLKRELGRLLQKLEDEQARRAGEPKAEAAAPAMPQAAREEAMELLCSPRLIERILADLDGGGMAGEEANKLLTYLACTSRLLPRPLAVVVQSSSAAGKSALIEAVLELMPEEAVLRWSAVSGQALYYLGERDLRHKILAIAEEEGAARAAYALKLLQSEGSLTMASTGKDPETGRLTTHEYRVEGPAAILLTTTAAEVDEELLNRCLVLGVDEEREQTRRIHERQREAETVAGLVARARRREVAALHQNAQRLLEPVAVVNEHAPRLGFSDLRTRARRDHAKYLALIRAIALLRQHQKRRQRAGGVEYIEAGAEDVALANRLAREALGRGMDELPPRTRRLLELLDGMVRQRCRERALPRAEYRFSRRQAREHVGWGRSQIAAHMARLEDMEYILPHRGSRGQSYVYELAYEVDAASETCVLPGLVEVYDDNLPGPGAELPGPIRPASGPVRPSSGISSTRADTASFTSLAAKEQNSTVPDAPQNRIVAAGAGE